MTDPLTTATAVLHTLEHFGAEPLDDRTQLCLEYALHHPTPLLECEMTHQNEGKPYLEMHGMTFGGDYFPVGRKDHWQPRDGSTGSRWARGFEEEEPVIRALPIACLVGPDHIRIDCANHTEFWLELRKVGAEWKATGGRHPNATEASRYNQYQTHVSKPTIRSKWCVKENSRPDWSKTKQGRTITVLDSANENFRAVIIVPGSDQGNSNKKQRI